MIKNAVASLLMVRAHLHHLPRAAPAPTYRRLLLPVPRLRLVASASVPAAAMSTAAAAAQAVADKKRALRTEVRKALKALSPDQRASEEEEAKDIYVPRVEDKNRNMRMLKITNMDDLVKNAMNILEPSPLDANGNDREDVLSASSPIDLFLLPGQAFDRTGRRLGRGGGIEVVYFCDRRLLTLLNGTCVMEWQIILLELLRFQASAA
ncbi:hypothetical protein PR202_ga29399 [Eleusine coracana subsp. coracana]|uniref:5-formyltetrahydrofolate cyclo-ligase n=1 Tax=Eleusine coracana subsp. coracana TaxID=191504 RepID=A0AAV5DL94_ELECO|nr:hypothetical protein PR202_ga29399 [Eleusine coracana subsp. coracana]